jgi:hypothetical protein
VVAGDSSWEASEDLDVKRLLLLAARRGWAVLYFGRTVGSVPVDSAAANLDDDTLYGRITPQWAIQHADRWQGITVGHSPPDLVVAGTTRSRPGAMIDFLRIRTPNLIGLTGSVGPGHRIACVRDGCIWEAGELEALLQAAHSRDVPLPVPPGIDRSGRPVVPVLVDHSDEDAAFVKALGAAPGVIWRAFGGRFQSLPPALQLLGDLPLWRGVVVPPPRPLASSVRLAEWCADLADWRIPLIGNPEGLAGDWRVLPAASVRDVRRAVASLVLTPMRTHTPPKDEPPWMTQAWERLAARGGASCRKE